MYSIQHIEGGGVILQNREPRDSSHEVETLRLSARRDYLNGDRCTLRFTVEIMGRDATHRVLCDRDIELLPYDADTLSRHIAPSVWAQRDQLRAFVVTIRAACQSLLPLAEQLVEQLAITHPGADATEEAFGVVRSARDVLAHVAANFPTSSGGNLLEI